MKERAKSLNKILEGQGSNMRIEYKKVFRNNGEKEGYILHGSDTNCHPIIYRDRGDWYNQSDGDVVDYLLQCYSQNALMIDVAHITSRDEILLRILPRVVSDCNIASLKRADIFYRFVAEGLVATLYLPINLPGQNPASVQLTNMMLDLADLTGDEAYDAAIVNLRPTVRLANISDVLSEITGTPIKQDESALPLYVLTNYESCYGAASLLLPGLDEFVKERIGERPYAIAPSSIHEVLVAVGIESDDDLANLSKIISEVNKNEVLPEEVLSYRVYGIRDGKVTAIA